MLNKYGCLGEALYMITSEAVASFSSSFRRFCIFQAIAHGGMCDA